MVDLDNTDKVSNASNAVENRGSFLDKILNKIKPYLKLYRNNRDIVFTLYSAIWFFFCTYFVSLTNSYADRVNTNVNNSEIDGVDYIAPDIILKPAHKYYKEHKWIPRDIADLLVRFSAAIIIIRALTLKNFSLTVTRRILLIMGFLYLLRACFIPLTVLPTPWVDCKKKYKDNIFWDALLLVLQIRVACGDVFFSGHTIMFTLNILEYWYYCKIVWLNVFVTIINVLGMFTLVMSAYHYSIDVFAAFIFSVIFWSIYHWVVQIPQLQGTWWGTIINWIDDPFYYERNSLPITYDPNGNGDGNISEILDMPSQQKLNETNNIADLEAGTSSPVNEITLLYEMNKEQQRRNSLKKGNSKNSSMNNNKNDSNNNLSETDGSITEEKVYRRKSVLSDSSIDNISNVNLSLNPNNADIQPLMDEEIVKREKFLTPNYGQISKVFKHNSLNSLSSNRSYSSDSNTNIPAFLATHKSHSNQFSVGSLSNNNISLGNSIVKSDSYSTHEALRGKSVSSNSSVRSRSNLNNAILIPGQSLSSLQSAHQSYEPARDLLKDTNSFYSGSGIIKNDSKKSNSLNGTTQFKTATSEELTVDSIQDSSKNRLTDSPKDITEFDEKDLK